MTKNTASDYRASVLVANMCTNTIQHFLYNRTRGRAFCPCFYSELMESLIFCQNGMPVYQNLNENMKFRHS
jgi:hypothetical protein